MNKQLTKQASSLAISHLTATSKLRRTQTSVPVVEVVPKLRDKIRNGLEVQPQHAHPPPHVISFPQVKKIYMHVHSAIANYRILPIEIARTCLFVLPSLIAQQNTLLSVGRCQGKSLSYGVVEISEVFEFLMC